MASETVFRITGHLTWGELGTLRRLNKHWCKSVDHSIRTARICSTSSIPTDLLLKFRRMERLSIENLRDSSLCDMNALQKLTSLNSLSIKGMRIGSSSLLAVSMCTGLKELAFYDTTLPSTCLKALDSLSQLSMLTQLKMVYLDIERVEFSGNHCVEMVSKLPNLRQLDLRFDMTSEVLSNLSTLTALESLFISSITLYIPDLNFLRPLTQLRTLSLPWTHFSVYGAEELDALINITSLDIGATDVTDDSLQDFSKLTNLKHLVLKDDCITDSVIDHISMLTDLVSLDISHGAGLSDVCSLRTLSELCGLKLLNLNGTHIGDSDMMLLTNLTSLEWLDIGLTDVTDNGIRHLSSITSLKKINTEIMRNHFDYA